MKKRKNNVFELVLTSIIGAVILILGFIPNVGFIQILPGVAVTIMHIPVIIGAFFLGLKANLFLGFLFGISSLFTALTRPTTPFDMAFVNPLISVVPRMLFSLSAYYIAKLFKRINNLRLGKHIIFVVIALTTVIGIFFGINHITKDFAYRDANAKGTQLATVSYEINLLENSDDITVIINEAKSEKAAKKKVLKDFKVNSAAVDYIFMIEIEKLNVAQIDNLLDEKNILLNQLEEEYPLLVDEAETRLINYRKITIPISIVIIVILVALYSLLTYKKDSKYTYISSVFIISTIIHTVLVIGTVLIVNPVVFKDTFGDKNILFIIYSIAAVNGVIEAFVGALIGTPIVTAALISREGDKRDLTVWCR